MDTDHTDKDWAGTPVDDHPLNPVPAEDVSSDEVPVKEELKSNVFAEVGTKSLEDVAKEVLAGDWGIGIKRRQALSEAGYAPNEVQDEIIKVVNAGFSRED